MDHWFSLCVCNLEGWSREGIAEWLRECYSLSGGTTLLTYTTTDFVMLDPLKEWTFMKSDTALQRINNYII